MVYKHNGIFGRANNLNNYIMSEAEEIFSSQLAKINSVSSSFHLMVSRLSSNNRTLKMQLTQVIMQKFHFVFKLRRKRRTLEPLSITLRCIVCKIFAAAASLFD